MSRYMRHFMATLAAAAIASTLLVACSGASAASPAAPTSAGSTSLRPSTQSPHLRAPDPEWIEICKDYPVGTTGPTVTFTVQGDTGNNGSVDQTFTTTKAGGTCEDIWVRTSGIPTDKVTITETVPAGYTASYVVTQLSGLGGTVTTQPSVTGNSVQILISNTQGYLIVFRNTPTTSPLPPPPPEQLPGTEGCTPGYWKQTQHFDSWVGYTPGQSFLSAFGVNAFPGETLLQVLSDGGGGLTALGRHTVAALLNASSSVDFGMTTAQVVAAFQSAYSSGDYETQKNIFADANERGCPLN